MPLKMESRPCVTFAEDVLHERYSILAMSSTKFAVAFRNLARLADRDGFDREEIADAVYSSRVVQPERVLANFIFNPSSSRMFAYGEDNKLFWIPRVRKVILAMRND